MGRYGWFASPSLQQRRSLLVQDEQRLLAAGNDFPHGSQIDKLGDKTAIRWVLVDTEAVHPDIGGVELHFGYPRGYKLNDGVH